MPTVKIDDVNIHFTQTGSGPPIVFIAGSSLGTFIWDGVIEKLGSGYRLVAVDVRGSGKSDAPRGPYSISAMAQEVRKVLSHLSIDEAVVVGHSMGGFVAQELALSSKFKVKGLFLLSTASCGKPNHLKPSPAAKEALLRKNGTFEEIFRGMLKVGLGSKFKRENPEAIEALVASQLKNPPRGFGFAGQRSAIGKFDSRSTLAKIKCHCLVVHGLEDQVIPIDCGLALHADITGSRFVEFDGVGHFPQVEAASELAEIMKYMAKSSF